MKKYLFFLVGIIGILALALTAYIFVRAFFLMDISSLPPQEDIKEPVYLVSYADGSEVFHKNQKMLTYSGLQHGVSYFFNYKKSLLDPQFLEKHRRIFDKGGAAYWIWKPWIIRDVLRRVPENAYVFYCDSGFVIKGKIQPLINLLKNHDMVLMAYTNKEMYGTLGENTKREALIKTHCNTEECFNSYLIWAGMLFMKNTPHTRQFIQKWLSYCEDEELISPATQFKNKHHDHHYDQSLLSIAYYQSPRGIALVSDEVLVDHVFKWHHRRKENNETLITKLNTGLRSWERKFIDMSLFRKLAEGVYGSFPPKEKTIPPLVIINGQ